MCWDSKYKKYIPVYMNTKKRLSIGPIKKIIKISPIRMMVRRVLFIGVSIE